MAGKTPPAGADDADRAAMGQGCQLEQPVQLAQVRGGAVGTEATRSMAVPALWWHESG